MEMMILQAVAPLVARAIGEAIASGDRQEADRLRRQAIKEYNIELPDLPQLEAELQGNTEFDRIADDSTLTGIENDALRSMYEQGQSGALTAAEKLSQFEGDMAAGEYARGTIGAGRREREARGSAGGVGMDALDELVAQQGAINRSYAGGMEAAARADTRRQNMLGAAGSFARGLRSDRFGRAAARAEAQDAINARNTSALNEIHKFNVGTTQQGFENQLGLADKKYRAGRERADDYDAYADRTVRTATEVGDGVSKGIGGIGKYRGWK